MITPSFGLTATERVLPKLALDWTTGLAQPGVDVTRAGVATFIGSNGLVQSATADTQRIDYSTGTAGLLVEETRTNSILRSEEFGTLWYPTRSGVDSNAAVSPDGSLTADKLHDSIDNNSHLITQSVTTTAVAWTFSCYAKAAEKSHVRLANASIANAHVFFDLVNGTVGQVGSAVISYSIKNVGNGWYRCAITMTATAATNVFSVAIAISDSGYIYQGNGSDGIYIWGAQLEAGAFATSYIPTTTTAVTRNADVATMTGTNFSDWFNPTEGTFVAHASIPSAGGVVRRILSINDTTVGESIQLAILGSSNGGYFEMRDGGAIQVSSSNGSFPVGSLVGYAFAYKLNDCAVSANSATATTDTSATIPTPTQMNIGSHSGSYMSGTVSRIEYYPQRLINTEVQAFSK